MISETNNKHSTSQVLICFTMCHSYPNHLGRRISTLSAHKHILTDMNPSRLGGRIPHTYSFVILNL